MKTLEWYPWYWQRWQADFDVSRLTLAEQGLYRALLDAAWKMGGLPDDALLLAKAARVALSEFRGPWKRVRPFWHLRDDGKLYNKALEEIRTDQVAAHARRVEAGKKGGRRPGKAMLSNAKQSLAIEKSRLTTLNYGTGRSPAGAAAVPVPIADLVGDPPTAAQLAELRAVKDALKGS